MSKQKTIGLCEFCGAQVTKKQVSLDLTMIDREERSGPHHALVCKDCRPLFTEQNRALKAKQRVPKETADYWNASTDDLKTKWAEAILGRTRARIIASLTFEELPKYDRLKLIESYAEAKILTGVSKT